MAGWHHLCKKDELPERSVKVFEVAGHRLALCRIGADEFYAVQDLCTHDDGPLGDADLMDHAIECPRHGARFDVRTGRVLALPAVLPIRTYPVKVEGDAVRVEL